MGLASVLPAKIPRWCGHSYLRALERQAFEDGLRDLLDSSHDVAPDFRGVEDIGCSAFEGAYDVARSPLRLGKAWGVGKVIGHGSLDRSRLDSDDARSGRMKTAAESLKKQGECAFGGSVNVVGAASAISGDGGHGGQAPTAPAFQIGGKQVEDRGGADKVDLQCVQENVDRSLGILLTVYGAVSEEHGIKVGKRVPGKLEDSGVLLNRGQVNRVSRDLWPASAEYVHLDIGKPLASPNHPKHPKPPP